MSDNRDQLEQRILKELAKTGYPTEIITGATLSRNGWQVIHNPSYRDADENISREFDLRAYREWTIIIPGGKVAVGVYLIVECKKSEKPWVFFTAPERYDRSRLGTLINWSIPNRRVFTDRDHAQCLIPDSLLRDCHHYFRRSALARTFYEPFKGKERTEASPMIYSAVMSAAKAVLFHIQDRPIQDWLRIYYPVVVFDGRLFEAEVAPDTTIQLQPAPHVQLSFHYIMPTTRPSAPVRQGEQSFVIDIVQPQHLDHFLDMLKTEHETLVDALHQALHAH